MKSANCLRASSSASPVCCVRHLSERTQGESAMRLPVASGDVSIVALSAIPRAWRASLTTPRSLSIARSYTPPHGWSELIDLPLPKINVSLGASVFESRADVSPLF